MTRHVTGGAVARAVETTLRAWMPFALWDVATRGDAVAVPPSPRSWVRPSNEDETGADQFPIVSVTTPRVLDTHRTQDSRVPQPVWDATWAVIVVVRVRGSSFDEVADLSKLYAAAVRAVGAHQPLWGEFASDTEWEAEEYDLPDVNDTRTLGGCRVAFAVTVPRVVGTWDWPDEPPPLPWPPTGYVADDIDLTVTRTG